MRIAGSKAGNRITSARALRDGCVFPSPFSSKASISAPMSAVAPVDSPQIGRSLAALPGTEVQAVANQMHNPGLDHNLGKGGGERLWKAVQPVHHRDQDTCGFSTRSSPRARDGALILGDPQPQNLAQALPSGVPGNIDGLDLYGPAVGIANLHSPRQRTPRPDISNPVPRSAIPGLAQNGISDAADPIVRDPQIAEIEQIRLDVAHRQTGGMKPDDPVLIPSIQIARHRRLPADRAIKAQSVSARPRWASSTRQARTEMFERGDRDRLFSANRPLEKSRRAAI